LPVHARLRFLEWLAVERKRGGRRRAAVALLGSAVRSLLGRGAPALASAEPVRLEQTLLALQDEGFLLTEGHLRSLIQAPASPVSGSIETIVVSTQGGRAELARCLESYAQNLAIFGRRARLLVSDDSNHDASRHESAVQVGSTARQFGLVGRHLTRTDRRKFAARLAAETGVPEEVTRFALLGEQAGWPDTSLSTLGANRNTVLLATLGEKTLSVDDDTVCRLAAPQPQCRALAFDSRPDPRVYTFHPDRASALAAAVPVPQDVLALHEALLGSPVQGIGARNGGVGDLSFDYAAGQIVEDICLGRGRVLLTTMGVAGHTGVKWPTRLLAMESDWAAQLLTSEERYRAAVRSPEVIASVPCTTLSDSSFFATMFFAVDNRCYLPPFMPVLRSQDALFWRILMRVQPEGYIGHLPWTAVHDPVVNRSTPDDVIWRHTGHELAYLLADVVEQAPRPARLEPADACAEVGEHLIGLASAPASEFAVRLSVVSRQRHIRRIEHLASRRSVLHGAPRFWTDDVDRHVAELRRVLSGRELPPPFDVGRSGEEGWRIAQGVTRAFGQVLALWPDLKEGARRLTARGDGLLRGDR